MHKLDISRELKRNSNEKGVYSSHVATLRTRRHKSGTSGNRSVKPYVRSRVFGLIRHEQWSPEKVSGWLRKEEGMKVSRSTIYNWIAACSPHHEDNIRRHLRHGGRKGKVPNMSGSTPIPNRVSIDERPAEADGRSIGDWEMDTIAGKDGKGAIVMLVDRRSCYVLMEKLETGKQAVPLAHAVVRLP